MKRINTNVCMLPTAKTYLHRNRIKLNKETKNELMNLVYDNISKMTRKQSNNLDKRLKTYDELIKLLPPDKHKLLLEYEELNLKGADLALEEAISFVIKNEKEVSEVLTNF